MMKYECKKRILSYLSGAYIQLRIGITRIIIALCLLWWGSADAFDKVVIWGHKLHTHTHSYVHNGFYKAFQFLGYKTYWFDATDDVSSFDFSNTLFLTEWQVDEGMPLRDDCLYVLHNCSSAKYDTLYKTGRAFRIQVYRKDLVNKPGQIEVKPYVFFDYEQQKIFMPWATDLLPHEIECIRNSVPSIIHNRKKSKSIYWVGTIGGGVFGNIEQLQPFMKACRENGTAFIHLDPWSKGVSVERNIQLVQDSLIAPAIVGTVQLERGYIPCRIFKAISYGQMGVTNSATVNALFHNKLIYHPDTYQLFFLAKTRLESIQPKEIYELMDLVKTEHTYLNRIRAILQFIELSNEQKVHQ